MEKGPLNVRRGPWTFASERNRPLQRKSFTVWLQGPVRVKRGSGLDALGRSVARIEFDAKGVILTANQRRPASL